MEDLFFARSARPMLIGATSRPYDDADSLFELKLDGERCLAYLDAGETVLVNRRGVDLSPRVPELSGVHRQSSARCILDGELVSGLGGKQDFEGIKTRLARRAHAAAVPAPKRNAAVLVVFDILYCGSRPVTAQPLEARKALLQQTVAESRQMALARTVEKDGKALFELVKQQGLEGVVGKKKQSLYYPGKRTKEWVKVKNVEEDDFVICGYLLSHVVAMLILGQYDEAGRLVYRGRVVLGLRAGDFAAIRQAARAEVSPIAHIPPAAIKPGEVPIWLQPALVCTVSFLHRTAGGLMRQPQYGRLRPDKAPAEATIQS